MLSVLSGALLMVASSLIGIAIKRIFRVRYAYFSDAVDFLNLYKREISSLQTPLEDVIKTFVSSSKGAFSDSLQKFADGLPAGFKNVEEVQKTIKNVMIKEKDSLLVAAFLHDVLEDTQVTADELEQKFGKEVLELVEGVTKLDKIKFVSAEDEQAENLRKMFFAMAKDYRVIIIKLADRLHNMRTLDALKPEKQIKIATQSLKIYAPLAGRLGLSFVKCELEDLAMRYLYPDDYYELVEFIKTKSKERQQFIEKICDELKAKLQELGIEGEVNGRQKHLYGIYKKMLKQGKNIEQIYDISAVRVIVNEVQDCYTVLGAIHTMWMPLPGRFKDYIAMPKPNGYQSLHTTVITKFKETFEIQIRTYEMHRIAEYGIAAGRIAGASGAWIDPGKARPRKICAIGVRASRFVTMHGFALNVSTDLEWFGLINPCGFVDRGVTSIERETGRTVPMDEVKKYVKDMDICYTDTWLDMEFFNDPAYQDKKKELMDKMMPYQLNDEFLEGSHALVFHDMPMHVGFEISKDVEMKNLDHILDQAENRRHAEKAVMYTLIKGI
mgnify:CR=1 FL=1